MKTVYVATGNLNKAKSIIMELKPYGITAKHVYVDIPEPRSYDIHEIATAKALFAYKETGKPCIVLDSGFFIGSLNGFPRTFVHYALDVLGINNILKLAKGNDRRCEFRECLAYYDGKKGKPKLFESTLTGILAERPMGRAEPFHWSELFQIFIPTGSDKTLAQMKKKEYLEWTSKTHKGSYMNQFAEWYMRK